MKKRVAAVFLVAVLCFVFVVFPQTALVKAEPNTIVVPDDYITIQKAVDNAEEGDTVFVKKGTYVESVYIQKSLSLVAEGSETKIVGDSAINGTIILIRHDNVIVSGFTLESTSRANSRRGIHLLHSRFCTVSDNSVTNCACAIWLYGASSNTIAGNNVIDNMDGVTVQLSDNNTFESNSVVDNANAIELTDSMNNVFRSNKLSLNSNNFVFSGTKPSYFNDVDYSNLIDNKPVCYWVNQHNMTVPSSAGYVTLVNCTGITVQDDTVAKKYKEILVVYTNYSEISGANVLVRLVSSFHNTITSCSATIQLEGSSWNVITNNYMHGGGKKILLYGSSENLVSDNSIKSDFGLVLEANSNGNLFYRNTLTDNFIGISITDSAHNLFRNNKLVGNKVQFSVSSSYTLMDNLFHYVDHTNTVNGKPVIYWVNETNKAVPANAGQVVLVNCDQIVLENLTLAQGASILLFGTKNSVITKTTLTNGQGIHITQYSDGNTVSQNTLTENKYGVTVNNSSRIEITENNITDSTYRGIQLSGCQNVTIKNNNIVNTENEGIALINDANKNTVSENFIAYNYVGIYVEGTSENLISGNTIVENVDWAIELIRDQHANRIYHNYFINNHRSKEGLQVSIPAVNYYGKYIDGYANIWDDGQKGNYWSDYQTRYTDIKEVENTGTGDIPFYINPLNIDNHPVMDPNIIPEFPKWTLLMVLSTATSAVLFYKKRLKQAVQQSY